MCCNLLRFEFLIAFAKLQKATIDFDMTGCILRSECGGTRWRPGGEVKGKLANGVGSQYSHTTSERGVFSITNADAHTSAASSRLMWLHPRFKWTRPFRLQTKSGFCVCAIRYCTRSTSARNNSAPNRTDVYEIWYLSIFSNLCR
jgi:hypothetical protein